jgi:tetratricopeptide (TPR) repeat protein
VIVTILLLVGVGGYFFSAGQKRAEREAQMNRWHQLFDRADLQSLKTVAREAGMVLSEDGTASGAVAAIDARAQLLVWILYSGADAQRFRAAQARWEAVVGRVKRAQESLDGGGVSTRGELAEAVACEVMLRNGDLAGAKQAVAGVSTPLGRTWAIRAAWQAGDVQSTADHAQAILTEVPSNETGRVMQALAAARTAEGDGGISSLGAMIEGDPPLTARSAATVTVELTRLMRRAGQTTKADQLLESYLEEDAGSVALQQEYARVQRFQGLFGAARTRADKALRQRGDHAGLLSELAAAAFFNDAPKLVRDRVRAAGSDAEGSDGVVRARALASLIEGNTNAAIQGLTATRHVGVPGETELWLAEAYLQSGDAAKAQAEAISAVELLTSSTGAGSREVVTARMYEGLAVAAGGDLERGGHILAEAFVDPNRTPWGAWLYGRFHEVAGDPRSAKDAYLLACHNGQDFSLSCFDLARLYDSLPASAIHRRTQKEAREHYLRTSPKGWHADEVRAALDR